jgi:V8-like Glu-specific endopeptidase
VAEVAGGASGTFAVDKRDRARFSTLLVLCDERLDMDREDRLRLLQILARVGELSTERGRRQTLINAGLGSIAQFMELDGPPAVAHGEIVERLDNYGRLPPPAETVKALGVFLNWIKASVGEEDQRELSAIISKYGMMVPSVTSPPIGDWRATTTAAQVQEKIVGENTLRDIAFLEEGQRVGRAVAYLTTPGWSGTGFLISEDLLITNAHVIPDRGTAVGARVRFNFQRSWSGRAREVSEWRPKDDGVFLSSPELDFTIVELAGSPGREWGWLPLRPATSVKRDDRVNIIQHAGGLHKQISFQNNFVVYVGVPLIQYVTSTLPGSSGSPVLDDRWQVVALHHAGGNLLEPSSGQHYFRNEGILSSAILQALGDLGARVAAAAAAAPLAE